MQNLYEQIDGNKRRSFFVIAFFILFITAFGYAITYLYDYDWTFLVGALGFSAIGSLVSYYYSDKIALGIAGAIPVTRKTHPAYLSAVENLSRVARIPQPAAYIIPSPALNAFATGRDPEHAAVAVTEGLLQALNRTEIEGVVAHELSHIKNFDTRLMTIVAILVGSITILLDWIWRLNLHGGGRGGDRDKDKSPLLMIAGILLIILAPIIAKIVQLAISRRREFYADASAALFTRQPSGLISALKKIDHVKIPLNQATPATAPLYISNPVHDSPTERWLGKLFSTHPPVAERIKALEGK